MADNYMYARVSNMHDVESNWNKCPNFIPGCGELIVYDEDVNTPYQRFKIGDGVRSVINLPFMVDKTIESLLSYKDDVGIVDAGRITDY